jgi:hypothetical protein
VDEKGWEWDGKRKGREGKEVRKGKGREGENRERDEKGKDIN